jgi:hypothetical protein
MKAPRINKSAKEMVKSAAEIAAWLKWDLQSLSDYHEYTQRFGGPGNAGRDVRYLVLSDALAYRGMTLEQFRAGVKR